VRAVPLIWDGYCRYENRCVFAHGLAELEKFSTQVRTDCCLPPPLPRPQRRWEKALGEGAGRGVSIGLGTRHARAWR
jgi:hypothetical protein